MYITQVGEIWVQSPSKALGYWGLEEQSRTDFHALVGTRKSDSNPGSDDGYLRTGDLGFLHKQELFVCGRLKDLIIIRGANHYPQDIERTVEKCSAEKYLRPGCCAAVAIDRDGGGENLVIMVEVSDANNPLYLAIAART